MAQAAVDRLLPPQSSELERALVQVAPAWDAFTGLGANLEAGRPAALAPWLAAEWELAQFAALFDSTEALIAAGLPWLFERGSAASVRRVLGWLGYQAGVAIEEDAAYLHIDLGRVAAPAEIERLAQVVRASLPAHMRLYRVFFAHDLRPIWLDRGPPLDAGTLDDDSGVWLGDVKASFGQRRAADIGAPDTQPMGQALTARRTTLLSYDDRLLLDAWRLDSHLLVDAYGGLSELFVGESTRPMPGAPERANGLGRIGEAPWAAPQPAGNSAQQRSERLPEPVLPPRSWTGPWAGPWRLSIELKRTEES